MVRLSSTLNNVSCTFSEITCHLFESSFSVLVWKTSILASTAPTRVALSQAVLNIVLYLSVGAKRGRTHHRSSSPQLGATVPFQWQAPTPRSTVSNHWPLTIYISSDFRNFLTVPFQNETSRFFRSPALFWGFNLPNLCPWALCRPGRFHFHQHFSKMSGDGANGGF